MEEVINICLDLSFPDKEFIIRKYLLKYLKDGVLEKLDCSLITDIFNILNLEEVEQFHDQIENIIGELLDCCYIASLGRDHYPKDNEYVK